MTPFVRVGAGGIRGLTARAVGSVLADATLGAGDVEAVWFSNVGVIQLRHEAADRHAEGAYVGLTQVSGGVIGTGEAAYSVHIFEGLR